MSIPEYICVASAALCVVALVIVEVQLRNLRRLTSAMLAVSGLTRGGRVSVVAVFRAVARHDLTPEQGSELLLLSDLPSESEVGR